MRHGNCCLQFSGNDYLNRERLLYGILVNGYKTPVHSCSKVRHVNNPIHIQYQQSNVVLPDRDSESPLNFEANVILLSGI